MICHSGRALPGVGPRWFCALRREIPVWTGHFKRRAWPFNIRFHTSVTKNRHKFRIPLRDSTDATRSAHNRLVGLTARQASSECQVVEALMSLVSDEA